MEIQDHQISRKCFAFGNSMSPSSIQKPIEVPKAKKPMALNFQNSKIEKSKQNRSMDYGLQQFKY